MKLFLSCAAALVLADQLSKQSVLSMLQPGDVKPVCTGLNIVLRFNRGGAFSMLQDQPVLALGLKLLIVGLLTIWLVRVRGRLSSDRWDAVALALVWGGALGNISDLAFRGPAFFQGAVIDFVDLYYGSWHFAAFNVADAAICTGVALLLLRRGVCFRNEAH